jgi:hypothetical protein
METYLLFAVCWRVFAVASLALAAARLQISTQEVNRTILVLLMAFPVLLSPELLLKSLWAGLPFCGCPLRQRRERNHHGAERRSGCNV